MDRRVAILRFYLLCLVAMLCAVVWPEFGVGLWPVAFLFPSCTCCGCIHCTSTPSQMQLDIAGITGTVNAGQCSSAACTALNGTWVLDLVGGGDCRWTLGDNYCTAIQCLIVEVNTGIPNYDVKAGWHSDCTGLSVFFNFATLSHTPTAPDCSAFSSLAINTSSAGSTNCDPMDTSTFTVTAL
jgi:hypothetical protein